MRIANGSRSSCSIQRNFITCRDSSGRAIQSDFLPGIAAQCHAVIQGDLVVYRSVCVGSLIDFRILVVSADGDRLGGDFLDIADVGAVGVCVIYRVARCIRAGCAAGYLRNLLVAAADAARGDAGAIGDGQARAAQGGRAGGHIAIASVKGDGIVARANGHLIRRELGVHLYGDDAGVVDLRGQVVRLVGMVFLGIIGADCHCAAQSAVDRLIGAIHLVAGREIQPFGDIIRIGRNLGLVSIYYIRDALQLILCSSTAVNRLGLPYSPCLVVKTGDVVPSLGGIIAIRLRAHLDAAGRHRIEVRILVQGNGQALVLCIR